MIKKLKKVKWYLKKYGFKQTLKTIALKVKTKLTRFKGAKPCYNMDFIENVPIDESIKFSIIVPLYNTEKKHLKEMIDSVLSQTYKNLELCLADGSDEKHIYVGEICKQYAKSDNRIVYKRLEKNEGISANSNACVEMATGDYIALLDHDDFISKHALYHNARTILFTGAEVVYSDEDHYSMSGRHINYYYKPDFSIELLRSHMYVCHFLVIKKALFHKVGGFDSRYDGSQDYDLMLRLSEATNKIAHIPMVLYSWRECKTSTAFDSTTKPYAHDAGRNALDAHLKRVYGKDAYAQDSDYTFTFDARYKLESSIKISIIMPIKDNLEMTKKCVNSILKKSTYANYELLIVNNNSEKQETLNWLQSISKENDKIKVIDANMEFNWSKINNYATTFASGDVYVFMNNDMEVITPDWLERLAENAVREDIGAVGSVLLYEDDTIQHAGVVVGMGGWADHIFKGYPNTHCIYECGSPLLSRNVSAVTGACMAVSKRHFDLVGGFDETFIVCGSDVEFCLRCISNGLINKCMGTVKLYHYESKTRDANKIPAIDFCRSFECYQNYNNGVDPYYSIMFDIGSSRIKLRSTKESISKLQEYMSKFPLQTQIYKNKEK